MHVEVFILFSCCIIAFFLYIVGPSVGLFVSCLLKLSNFCMCISIEFFHSVHIDCQMICQSSATLFENLVPVLFNIIGTVYVVIFF